MDSAYNHSWQYNGVAPFEDIRQWCRRTFGYSGWSWRNETIFFVHKTDYVTFLLRWSR